MTEDYYQGILYHFTHFERKNALTREEMRNIKLV
jgi:hypothetical protein